MGWALTEISEGRLVVETCGPAELRHWLDDRDGAVPGDAPAAALTPTSWTGGGPRRSTTATPPFAHWGGRRHGVPRTAEYAAPCAPVPWAAIELRPTTRRTKGNKVEIAVVRSGYAASVRF